MDNTNQIMAGYWDQVQSQTMELQKAVTKAGTKPAESDLVIIGKIAGLVKTLAETHADRIAIRWPRAMAVDQFKADLEDKAPADLGENVQIIATGAGGCRPRGSGGCRPPSPVAQGVDHGS